MGQGGKLTARRHPVTQYRLYLKKKLEDFLRQFHRNAGSTPGTSQADGKPVRRKRNGVR
jgi:hypothetical protein